MVKSVFMKMALSFMLKMDERFRCFPFTTKTSFCMALDWMNLMFDWLNVLLLSMVSNSHIISWNAYLNISKAKTLGLMFSNQGNTQVKLSTHQ